MAVYHRVDDLVTCGLTVCTPGSAPGPMIGNEYRRTLPFTFLTKLLQVWPHHPEWNLWGDKWFLKVRCASCHPTNSVAALKGTQPQKIAILSSAIS